jgi:ribonuclease VapC
MFVDASAWTAILLGEPERDSFRVRLASTNRVLTSPIANWETIRAVARETNRDLADVEKAVSALQASFEAQQVRIGGAEQMVAVGAHARFGKGVHPARLNMGDCFAYACAWTQGVPLLFKGDDFSLTDIEPA